MVIYCAILCLFSFQSPCSFIERNDILAFEELSQTASIEVSTCDLEVAYSGRIDRLFALLLELECHLIFFDFLDWFRRHSSTLFFDHFEWSSSGIAEQADDEIASKEDNALARVLELLSVLRQVSDIESRCILFRLCEE